VVGAGALPDELLAGGKFAGVQCQQAGNLTIDRLEVDPRQVQRSGRVVEYEVDPLEIIDPIPSDRLTST
jgi:hypothetical protein